MTEDFCHHNIVDKNTLTLKRDPVVESLQSATTGGVRWRE